MPLGLEAADDAPPQRGQCEPPPKRLAVDGCTRGGFIGRQEALDTAQAARPEMFGRAEAPGPDTEPCQVLVRLADVHEFPIQHGSQTGFVDDQVSHPEIPVHQACLRRRGPVRVQPAKRPLECGRGVAHVVEPLSPFGELVDVGQAHPIGVGAMDGCQRLRALLQQPFAAGLVKGALDPPDDRFAADGVANEVRIAQCGRGIVRRKDVRDGCTRSGRALLNLGLQFHSGMHVVGRTGAQDQ